MLKMGEFMVVYMMVGRLYDGRPFMCFPEDVEVIEEQGGQNEK
ncbi:MULTISPECIES: hypothetical protein [unclassified Acinetobacter]|nr:MULTISPECIES: hypothetical protein [unclassified Acinetobacter]